MHNSEFRLSEYLEVLSHALSVERDHLIANCGLTASEHNGMTLYNNTVEANFNLAEALSLYSKQLGEGIDAKVERVLRLTQKAFRGMCICYGVVFANEQIDFDVIEARLKWSDAIVADTEVVSENAEQYVMKYTELFSDALGSVVLLLKNLSCQTYERQALVTAMRSISILLRRMASLSKYKLSELCKQDVDYLKRLMPGTFTTI
jgi:hypothetical protein